MAKETIETALNRRTFPYLLQVNAQMLELATDSNSKYVAYPFAFLLAGIINQGLLGSATKGLIHSLANGIMENHPTMERKMFGNRGYVIPDKHLKAGWHEVHRKTRRAIRAMASRRDATPERLDVRQSKTLIRLIAGCKFDKNIQPGRGSYSEMDAKKIRVSRYGFWSGELYTHAPQLYGALSPLKEGFIGKIERAADAAVRPIFMGAPKGADGVPVPTPNNLYGIFGTQHLMATLMQLIVPAAMKHSDSANTRIRMLNRAIYMVQMYTARCCAADERSCVTKLEKAERLAAWL